MSESCLSGPNCARLALAAIRLFNGSAALLAPHLLAEMFNHAVGTRMEIITYKGGAQAATDVVGGQVEALWSVLPAVLPFISNSRLRFLAVASEKRTALLPQVPTMGESGWPAVR